MIMKNTTTLLVCLNAAFFLSPAIAQNSKGTSSLNKGPDPLQTVTKPITPKSAMTHKPSSAGAAMPMSSSKTDAELANLERQNSKTIKAGTNNPTTNARTAKSNPPNPTKAASGSGSGSGINAQYQKPHIPKN